MKNYSNNGSLDHQEHQAKGTEVFVGGLPHSVTESQIREVFTPCGEILELRMIKDQAGSSKGYCFLKFLTREAAGKAVKEKNGMMLEGRKIGVLPSAEQNSLFLGNLPKEWTTGEFDSVVRQVFQDVVSVNLVVSQKDGTLPPGQKIQNRGFGFVQFSSHAAAARAFRMGSRSDFVIGSKCHPTVQWAEIEPEIDPEELAKVKVAFVKNLPAVINEDFMKKLFESFGEIEKVVLSKKGQSQVAFVHFSRRLDLDNAVREMNDKQIERPNAGSFKLQVEVARPFEKSKKRARESSSKTVSESKVLKAEPAVPTFTNPALKVIEEPFVADAYEAAVVSLPVAVKDRLLRVLRLGIATRYDVDIQCLRSLKEISESAAISALDQFLLSGAEERDRGAFLAGLIAKYHGRSMGTSQMLGYTSRASDITGIRSDFEGLSRRTQVPIVDSLSSHGATTISRYDSYYLPRSSCSDYPLSPRIGITRTMEEQNVSPPHFSGSSPSYRRMGMLSSAGLGASANTLGASPHRILGASSGTFGASIGTLGTSHRSSRAQVRFDPYTGEPYKFDPFTGEPIQPESVTRDSGRLY